MKRAFFVFVAAMLCRAISADAQTLSYSNLVSRLTGLEYLATLPASGDRCALWSSYDRGR
jgi:hypothetical protein